MADEGARCRRRRARPGAGVGLSFVVLLGVLASGWPVGARAQEAAQVTVTPGSGAVGATVTLHGSGWPPGVGLVVHLYQASDLDGPGAAMGMAFQAESDGRFSTQVTVPSTLFGAGNRGNIEVGPGAYTIVVRAGPELWASTPFTVGACQYVLGFETLHALIPETVGECLTDEFHGANGDGLQITTGPPGPANGLLVWRKADNWTAYTDGYRTWVNGPFGLQTRLNSERFCWETDAGPDCIG